MLVTRRRLHRLQVRQAVQALAAKDAGDRAVTNSQITTDLTIGLSLLAALDNALATFRIEAMRAVVRTRAPVVQARYSLLLIPPEPLVRGTYADSCGLGCFSRTQAVLNNAPHKKLSTIDGQSGILWLFIRGPRQIGLFRTSNLPGIPRVNNLPRDHT